MTTRKFRKQQMFQFSVNNVLQVTKDVAKYCQLMKYPEVSDQDKVDAEMIGQKKRNQTSLNEIRQFKDPWGNRINFKSIF